MNQLNEVLSMISQIKEEKDLIEKVYDYLESQIMPEWERRSNKIELPEKFEKLVHEMAEFLEMQHNVYLNLDTLEVEGIPSSNNYLFEEFEEMWGEIKHENWENMLVLEPLGSRESFKIMEGFMRQLNDRRVAAALENILNQRKPFANFKKFIDNSPYREDWFAFRLESYKDWVRQEIYWEIDDRDED